MLVAGAALAALVLTTALVDEGEVVVLTSSDAQGHGFETRLWLAEIDGELYVRAYRPDAVWLQRLRARPVASLTRRGVKRPVRATPVEDTRLRDAVNRAMAAKYGRADRWLRRLHGSAAPIAVHLEPTAAPR
jgi:hypothetical protein